jgi:hypothetical protein
MRADVRTDFLCPIWPAVRYLLQAANWSRVPSSPGFLKFGNICYEVFSFQDLTVSALNHATSGMAKSSDEPGERLTE